VKSNVIVKLGRKPISDSRYAGKSERVGNGSIAGTQDTVGFEIHKKEN
jgi:hypothetical protein